MTDSAVLLLQQAAGQLNSGDTQGAWASYMAAIQAQPGNSQAWLGLGLTALLRRDWTALVAVADRRQALAGDGFAWFHDVLTAAMGYGLGPLIEELGQSLDGQSPYVPSQLYYAGCTRLRAGDEDGAFLLFNRLKPLLHERRQSLPIGPGDRFNIAWRQATLVEDCDYPDQLDPGLLAERAAALPPLREKGRRGRVEQADFVVLAACDGRYLDRFGADFLRSLAAHQDGAVAHLHVVQPDPAVMDVMLDLAEGLDLPLVLSAEDGNPWQSGAYYACARFLVAGTVRNLHGGKPLMATDIDIRFTRKLGELAGLARPFAFASFVYDDGLGPSSRLPAVWTWFAGDLGGAMLDSLRRTLLSKLDVPWPHNWMLDQAGLMTARRWLRRHHPDAAIGEINHLDGQGYFTDFLECLGDEDDKAALIRDAGQKPKD